jgi:hypothetical protein
MRLKWHAGPTCAALVYAAAVLMSCAAPLWGQIISQAGREQYQVEPTSASDARSSVDRIN